MMSALSPKPVLSIVIPMKNEAAEVAPLTARLSELIERLGLPAEVIAVDDGSIDDTLDRLKTLRERMPYLKVVSLTRNFGKEIAVVAGFEHASGQVVVLMDADLGHPPETIAEMLARWREGWQVVYAQRCDMRRTPAREVFTRIFYRSFKILSEIEIDPDGGDFMALDRKVVNAFLGMRERHRFTRGLVAWAGFRTTSVPVTVAESDGRHSRWNFTRLAGLAVNAVTSFGTLPLRIWTFVGMTISALSLIYAMYIFGRTLAYGSDVPGFPTLAVAVTFLAGVQLIGLGILGEYVGRIFAETKGRPLYLVQEAVGFDAQAPESAPIRAA